MKRIILFTSTAVVSLLLSSLAVAGGFNKGGRTVFQFVKIGVGARQVSLGEASISSVMDVNSVFWNPANITSVESGEASFSYTRWFADLKYFAGAVGIRWKGVGVFALSYASLDYGEIDEALVLSPTGRSDTRTGSTFSGDDLLVGLSYSREFTDRLSIGVSMKYLREALFRYDVSLLAFDIGTNYDTRFKGLRFAMSAQNFSGSVNFSGLAQPFREEGYDIPLVFRIGASVDLIAEENSFIQIGDNHRFIISSEAINSNDYGDRYHFGGEYWFSDFLGLRVGHRINYAEGNWSFGVGLKSKVSGIGMKVDYAYVGYEFLESPHRLTVSFGL